MVKKHMSAPLNTLHVRWAPVYDSKHVQLYQPPDKRTHPLHEILFTLLTEDESVTGSRLKS